MYTYLDMKETGIFRDVLETHRDCLRRCIYAAGGWKKAYLDLTCTNNSENNDDNNINTMSPLPLDADVSYWPVEMRCKLLEHIRDQHISGKQKYDGVSSTSKLPPSRSSATTPKPGSPGDFELVDHVGMLLKNERTADLKSSRLLEVYTFIYIHAYIPVIDILLTFLSSL